MSLQNMWQLLNTNVSYNTEMQNKNEYNLPLRSRYYQVQLDVGSLKPGEEYTKLKPLYVIFICNFDPFKEELYRYTFSMQCEERGIPLNDGVKRIFLSTKGKNKEEVSALLIDFLGYLTDSTDSYVEQHSNEKVKEIHERIKILKKNRDVESRYMHYLYVDKLIEEKENALEETKDALEKIKNIAKEMLFETIEEMGTMSEEVRKRIENEKDINNLKSMHRAAVKSDTMKQFEEYIANL